MSPRRDELAARLREVRERIARACDAANRDAEGVTLIVVTKFFPATDVADLRELGVSDIGESRDQEARAKLADPVLAGGVPTCHFIGQVQTNKAASICDYAQVVHTVDRPKLGAALARAADARGRQLRVLLQLDLDPHLDRSTQLDQPGQPGQPGQSGQDAPHQGRGGVAPGDLAQLATATAAHPSLVLGGVMAVAPRFGDPDAAFARLAEAATGIRRSYPGADWVSAGMSGDLEAALRHGATHLRVGSAILGTRPALR